MTLNIRVRDSHQYKQQQSFYTTINLYGPKHSFKGAPCQSFKNKQVQISKE